ncbi:DNA Mismatch repair protein [Enterospora canceri]|uniref:DNA Mismatch repair protein n=1 Tax=Enterospora canceri TaxID=1081671 RepID=A0A1Y1S8R8_9MICR|nr:DNA Mismatch repair protein [Enterospora canceri]
MNYEDLKKEAFKYFVSDEDVFVYRSDTAFLPPEYTKEETGSRVEFKIDRIESVVKYVLQNKNTRVEEYVACGDVDRGVCVQNIQFKLNRIGHSRNYGDFSDLDVNSPTICSVEKFNKGTYKKFRHKTDKMPEYSHVFAYARNNKLFYTFYLDDDLFSTTFSLVQMYNCVEVLFTDGSFQRIFDGWGVSSNRVTQSDLLIETYFTTTFQKEFFELGDFCLVNINDFDLVDFHTQTAQGKRLLNQWLRSPLLSKNEINKRLDLVEHFKEVDINLSKFFDLKRLVAKIENRTISVDEIVNLYESITVIPLLIDKIGIGRNQTVQEDLIDPLRECHQALKPVQTEIESQIDVNSGEMFVDQNETSKSLKSAKVEIEGEMEKELAEIRQSFPGAKMQNGVFKVTKKEFGHTTKYKTISVTKTGVTFTTKMLTELSNRLEETNRRILAETRIQLDALRSFLCTVSQSLEIYNFVVALVDIFKAFSIKCITPGYSRPSFSGGTEYAIRGMWHPAIKNEAVKNDLEFSKNMCVLTGPNMGGKSTFIKTLSLVSLYAQIGCYVPASAATLPIFERIVMRIGARDVSSQHMSTFMVEMADLNLICRNRKFALVLIDELGRGTSASDGLSIILGVKEFLERTRNFTVITTHFSELSQASSQSLIKRMAVKDGLFTYKVEEGAADDSFGIKVAEMAQFPRDVIEDALRFL